MDYTRPKVKYPSDTKYETSGIIQLLDEDKSRCDLEIFVDDHGDLVILGERQFRIELSANTVMHVLLGEHDIEELGEYASPVEKVKAEPYLSERPTLKCFPRNRKRKL